MTITLQTWQVFLLFYAPVPLLFLVGRFWYLVGYYKGVDAMEELHQEEDIKDGYMCRK